MTELSDSKPSEAAVDFDRPLLLTPSQDMAGFVRKIAGRVLLTAVASMTILAVLLIFVFIVQRSMLFLTERGILELFTSRDWTPTHEPPHFGALTLVYGTFAVTAGAMLIAAPVGILAAVFLSDVISFRLRQLIKPVIEILAAIPSVAYGFFALLVVAPKLQEWGLTTGTNALNASVMLAIMAVPTIVSISEDALTAVGRDLREGAYALGATRAEVLVKVIIPAAHSGIIAAVILGMMRAVGETMLLWMAAGNATNIPSPWWDLTESVRALTATIAAEMAEAPKEGMHRSALFTLGLVLLTITFALNIVSEFFLARAKRRVQGKGK